jgi:hypothetical protein
MAGHYDPTQPRDRDGRWVREFAGNLAALIGDILAEVGTNTSGNYMHGGVKGQLGGSAPGGGHSALGVPAGAPVEDKTKAVTARREEVAAQKAEEERVRAEQREAQLDADAKESRKELELMSPEAKMEILKKAGGVEWQKGDKHNVYYNDTDKLLGLDLSHYKTGHISSASLDGKPISNSAALKMSSKVSKAYYDMKTQQFIVDSPEEDLRKRVTNNWRREIHKAMGRG